jgi:hypothetical protein
MMGKSCDGAALQVGSKSMLPVENFSLKRRSMVLKLAFPASYPEAAMLVAMTGAITTRGPYRRGIRRPTPSLRPPTLFDRP